MTIQPGASKTMVLSLVGMYTTVIGTGLPSWSLLQNQIGFNVSTPGMTQQLDFVANSNSTLTAYEGGVVMANSTLGTTSWSGHPGQMTSFGTIPFTPSKPEYAGIVSINNGTVFIDPGTGIGSTTGTIQIANTEISLGLTAVQAVFDVPDGRPCRPTEHFRPVGR